MILRIEPDIQTYLDALTGEYCLDAHVEQRIVEAWFACITKRGGVTTHAQALCAVERLKRKHGYSDPPLDVVLREHARTWGSGEDAAAARAMLIAAVADLSSTTDAHTVVNESAHLATAFLARRVLARHIAQMYASIEALQLTTAHGAGDRAGKTLTPATAYDVAAIGFSESANRMAYHLTQLDATLFELLTRLPVVIEGPRSPRPFSEADLVAAGFPTADERTAWAAGAALPVRSLGAPQQPITRSALYGGRHHRGN